ncbi:DUF397 domain-containing protein [Streptomyces sp. NPDC051684]|uniref:DUF397 domain-containing protein n=1 Tax=Streptomyces sp. NPDC051684 TaxID=3365670 RepID=UPI0037AFEBA4
MPPTLTWFKSSYSDDEGGNCLEAARSSAPTRIHVRDSKLGPQSPAFTATATAWNAFLTHARAA